MSKKSSETNTSGKEKHFLMMINNPKDHGWTQQKLIDTAFAHGKVRYYVISDEIGAETHTYHTHFFVSYVNNHSIKAIWKAFAPCHFEVELRGTFSQIRNYVLKEGKKFDGTEKQKTRVAGTQHEWGDIPRDRRKVQGLDKVQARLDAGEDLDEVMLNVGIIKPQIEQGIKNYYMRLRDSETKGAIKDQKVFVHLGENKNYLKKALQSEITDYFIIKNYRHPFDNYTGQRVLFLDRFKGQMEYGDFLTIIDNIKVDVDARYNTKKALWNEVHIISNWSFNDILYAMLEKDKGEQSDFDIDEVLEKITEFHYHFKKNGHDCIMVIPAEQFLYENDILQQVEAIKSEDAIIIDAVYYDEDEEEEGAP